ncbi:hypothetical protein GUITHDRAFT_118097 [Guillardia theta CCMP2712]|uniref:Uncharacterized protein n=1 Tax=Guillardia theta (strain CCMP2712) TaxID=905079 RepID=L1IHI2_GUITC|nr:hypothetical protein GUITHDRAFT_118097 [Guillardia theta CCMP2712]EKX35711.1 hypothetical protein GUITHDRAFT_118097 [Guillardia theta CCMP2712]|eukprot:XP_005822691.1 hypothetical protein GUITHDRAFT_118097 [Guillardia theta CCMP2712]
MIACWLVVSKFDTLPCRPLQIRSFGKLRGTKRGLKLSIVRSLQCPYLHTQTNWIMVRPSASEENRNIALSFAKMITTPTEDMTEKSVVLRSGSWSIYSALSECCPWTIRNHDPVTGRCGLTEIEFNKTLEKNGFKKIRDRSSSFKWLEQIEEVDMKNARYFFAGRRWKNPDIHSEYLELKEGWESIRASCPYAHLPLGGRCSFQNLVSVCRKFHNGWNCIIRCVQRPLKRKIPGLLSSCGEQGKRARKGCGGRQGRKASCGSLFLQDPPCLRALEQGESSSTDLGGRSQALKVESCFALADSFVVHEVRRDCEVKAGVDVRQEEEKVDSCPAHRTTSLVTTLMSEPTSSSQSFHVDQEDCLSLIRCDADEDKVNVCFDSILHSSLASYFLAGQQDVENFVEEIGEDLKEKRGTMNIALASDEAMLPLDSTSFLQSWL